VKIYVKDENCHLRFDYETKLIWINKRDRQGKVEKKIGDSKPDVAMIFDGSKAQVVTFSRRPGRASCRIDILDSLKGFGSVNDDLTRLWLKEVGLEQLTKTMKGEDIRVTDLGGEGFRLGYEPKWIPGGRVEIDLSSKANYNPTRYRMTLPKWDEDYMISSAKWKRARDVWYVQELDMTSRVRLTNKPGYSVLHSICRSERFEPNVQVDPQLLTLDCLAIPPRNADVRPSP
jgi:hypothetical protein